MVDNWANYGIKYDDKWVVKQLKVSPAFCFSKSTQIKRFRTLSKTNLYRKTKNTKLPEIIGKQVWMGCEWEWAIANFLMDSQWWLSLYYIVGTKIGSPTFYTWGLKSIYQSHNIHSCFPIIDSNEDRLRTFQVVRRWILIDRQTDRHELTSVFVNTKKSDIVRTVSRWVFFMHQQHEGVLFQMSCSLG